MSSQSIQRQSINNQSFNPGTKRVNIKDNKSLSIFDALDANGDGVLGADESLGIVTAKNGKKYYKSKKIENNRYIVVDENGQKHTMSHDGVILSEAYLKQQAQKQQNDKNNKSKTNTNNQTKTNKQQKTQESKPQPTNKQQTNNQTKANNYQVSVFEQNDNGQNKKFVIAKNGKKYEFVKKIENNRYVVIDEKGEQRIMSHDGGILSGKYLAQTASQSDQNKAKKEFKKQQDKDGNAAKIADAVSVLWGSENRASVVKNDLDENQRKLNELARSSKNDKEYRANFKKMFGVEYNESAVVAYTANPTKENYEKAFGKGQRITDRVEDYNNSQDMGGAIVKAGAVIAATGVVGTLTGGVGLIGAAAIGACTSAAVNISDRLSSNNGLQGDDWGEIIEDAAIDSVTIGTAGGIAKVAKVAVKGSTIAAKIGRAGINISGDIAIGAAAEYVQTGDVTASGAVINGLTGAVGQAAEAGAFRKAGQYIKNKVIKTNRSGDYSAVGDHGINQNNSIPQHNPQYNSDYNPIDVSTPKATQANRYTDEISTADNGARARYGKIRDPELSKLSDSELLARHKEYQQKYAKDQDSHALGQLNKIMAEVQYRKELSYTLNEKTGKHELRDNKSIAADRLPVDGDKIAPKGAKYKIVNNQDDEVVYYNNRINTVKTKLDNVLSSEYCPMPDYMSQIPKDYSEEEVVAALAQMFEDSKFFSRVSTCEMQYGKNFAFAEMMSKLSKESTKSIYKEHSFEKVLSQIAKGYSKETTINTEFKNRIGKSGIYRGSATKPPEIIEGWGRVDSCITGYGCYGVKDGYKAYVERLNSNLNKRISPYENFTLTKRVDETMLHPYHEEVAKNMEIIADKYKIYQKLVAEYKKTGVLRLEQRNQADDIISEIYYLMANTCPFHRGSNGISDILMRSQYAALGINKPHIKQGVGLDLEAFCMNLDEYKIKWNSFFEL